ncbi:hypothetical protein PPERSA_05543 [Pseudocohnilembus persalinus]|uniref:Uncharacterized protein n=1 Tax=Pseudocohnilembus persalinus TaxID=266149 RepID=A0A0V0QTX0_PSEPJ|nr:hypothetical protein PPERSA_05543 [Pseudocohnilembus persalinus]|eukprot:KRX05434.1 hypothetical protein PPERSA_05543 [Pseudocohnilembus persalinus]
MSDEETFTYIVKLNHANYRKNTNLMKEFIQQQAYINGIQLDSNEFQQRVEIRRDGTQFDFKIKSNKKLNEYDLKNIFPTESYDSQSPIKTFRGFELVSHSRRQKTSYYHDDDDDYGTQFITCQKCVY